MYMGGQSLATQNWVGSRIQENKSINLPKEEEHLLPWEELQISVEGGHGLGLRGETEASKSSSLNSNVTSCIKSFLNLRRG